MKIETGDIVFMQGTALQDASGIEPPPPAFHRPTRSTRHPRLPQVPQQPG